MQIPDSQDENAAAGCETVFRVMKGGQLDNPAPAGNR
jgi:hypothetical protein